ncbi:BlaI/MecI/CopY family transcriptional regulator [Catenulispora sp. NF23]|uniref:BlaI/MecI/CopY family transcriptional regulator n=1 Tax=Catenulispora pinistramenti TaxID=2705254 RepID=A0ABS5L552_9ACTN|nr:MULTISPECIES: BlaI/MecI/CopY family transcriptional regulator [Catenulispora]MBS2536586.1 BlaI/MecI/CopY family transcriptional regulator [Catenulispora pinistramenti]MBS2553431.1 BlaI/MecI/CopY family transcriptional regulator [Catenulispora pinistramenti]
MATGRRPAGALEQEVLATLWAAGHPLTPAAVQEQVGGGLAYTTVKTILDRLHDKKMLTRVREGKAYAYTPVVEQADLAAEAMRAALEGSSDRPAVLSKFLDEISADDAAMIRELLGDSP